MNKANQTVMQKCALCYEEKNLKESHIVPKFIFSYIKKTSITSKLRDPADFNKRLQDGPKYKLLCGDCEQLFSESEKYFAEKVFALFVNNKKINFKYDYNFQYFIESIHWRFLLTQMQLYEGKKLQILKDIEISIRAKLGLQKKMEKTLFLLKLDNPQYPRWSSHSMFSLDENIITILNYGAIDFKRMVTCDLFFYKKQVYIYSYYCGLIVYSCYNCSKFDLLNLRYSFIRSKGRFKLRSKSFNHVIEHLLTIKCVYIIDSLEKVSDKDREKYQNIVKKAKGIAT